MSIRQDISKEDYFFTGEKKTIEFDVTDDAGVPQDVSDWRFEWAVRAKVRDETALLTKTTDVDGGIAITGAFSAIPASNTQRVIVTVDAVDFEDIAPGHYSHALKRTDIDAIITFGDFDLRQAAAH